MKTTGQHLLVEYRGCDPAVLNDQSRIEALMREAAQAARATIVGTLFRRFSPHGVSGVVVVEESHLSIHTWPEHGYAAVDFYTCGDCLPREAYEVLREGLAARTAEIMTLERGQSAWPGIRVREHVCDRARPRAGRLSAAARTAALQTV